jgi:hypothetical protein
MGQVGYISVSLSCGLYSVAEIQDTMSDMPFVTRQIANVVVGVAGTVLGPPGLLLALFSGALFQGPRRNKS